MDPQCWFSKREFKSLVFLLIIKWMISIWKIEDPRYKKASHNAHNGTTGHGETGSSLGSYEGRLVAMIVSTMV